MTSPYRKPGRPYIASTRARTSSAIASAEHIMRRLYPGTPKPNFDDLSEENQEKVLDLWHAGMPIWEWFHFS